MKRIAAVFVFVSAFSIQPVAFGQVPPPIEPVLQVSDPQLAYGKKPRQLDLLK